MSQYTRSQAGFLRKPCLPSSSPLPPLFLFPLPTLWGSCLFRFTPPQGIPCGWLTENTSYWTTQTGPRANSSSARTRTQQQTHTCAGCAQFASVILWVTEWSSGAGRGIWKVEVIIFRGTLRSPAVATAMSCAHLILRTSQGGDRQTIKTTQGEGEED